ncbi:MAG: hypothetical protein JNM36_16265 [Chitinophagales bacterium]|nr:hypothetical protein [Chitinophagales bacterium]HNI43663.1 hypothetical protein [Chitinophagales bacterium]HNL06059.1 hypothetical protein [Chitinophagales bacterium]
MAKKQKSLDLLEPILIKTFGLERLRPPKPILQEWITIEQELTLEPEAMTILDRILIKIIDNGDSWNEEELKMNFISILMFLADFNDPIKGYYDREISATVGGIYLNCKADMMLSKGIGELIETPYFFLHEYKREKKYSGDPIGQMLGGMLIGQAKNNNNKPIYGCYVQGRYWYFSVLEGKKYVISNSFNASELEDVCQIVFILRKLKKIILEYLIE